MPATDSATRGRPTNVRWVIFALSCLASYINYVHRYAWGVVKPYLQADYQLNDIQMGWLDSAFNLSYALCQFPGGLAGDLIGPRMMITLAAVCWSFMVGLPGAVSSYWRLYGIRLAFGTLQAPAYPNLGKVTKEWFPLSVRTTIQGFVASFSGRAGAASASLIVGALLMGRLHLSWQSALWVLAGCGLLFAALFWTCFRDRPAAHPSVNAAEQTLINDGHATVAEVKTRFDWSFANIRNIAWFLSASFCSTFADNLFVFYMPKFLVEEKQFSALEMGLFASLPLWGGALGGLCGGVINDAMIRLLKNRRLARSLVAATGKSLAAILIVASLQADDGRMIMLILFFCKFFSDWSQPTWWGTVTDIGGPAAGRVFGICNTVGSIGAFVAGPCMGYVLQYHDWSALFGFVGAIYVLTAFWWALVNCTRRLVVEDDRDLTPPSTQQDPTDL